MPTINTKVLIIITGVLLIILVVVTIFINTLSKNSQTNQEQPTLIPTGVFDSSGNFQGDSLSLEEQVEDPLALEGDENVDEILNITDEEIARVEELKNRTPLDTADFTIGYSSNLGEFFITTKTPQGEEEFKQYLAANGLSNVFNKLPGLFHVGTKPLGQFIRQTEETRQREDETANQKLVEQIAEQQKSRVPSSQHERDAQKQETEKQLTQFFGFLGSLSLDFTGGRRRTTLRDVVNNFDSDAGDLGTGGDSVGGGGSGGSKPISATARELLNNPRLTMSSVARHELKTGIINDERLINILASILQDHSLNIWNFKGNRYLTASGSISNHYYGRAADVGSVDGKPVSSSNRGAHDIVVWTTRLDCPIRPGEMGYPAAWADEWFDSLTGWFGNSDHNNHLHIGYYKTCNNPKP